MVLRFGGVEEHGMVILAHAERSQSIVKAPDLPQGQG